VKDILNTLYQGKVGFGCLTPADRVEEERTGSSLLYGEVLREGIHQISSLRLPITEHLDE
jgi:hypothetical protein